MSLEALLMRVTGGLSVVLLALLSFLSARIYEHTEDTRTRVIALEAAADSAHALPARVQAIELHLAQRDGYRPPAAP